MKKRRASRKRPDPVGDYIRANKARLGFYDPCSDSPPELIGPVWTMCGEVDPILVRLLIRAYNRLARRQNLTLCMGVFPLK